MQAAVYIAAMSQQIVSENEAITLIAGVDEAGRGPLAGPVVAAAIILDPQQPIEGLRDSKTLSPRQRERFRQKIIEHAAYTSVGIVHEQDIDRRNILQATFEAMRLAVKALPITPERVMVDGNHTIPELGLDQTALIKGDSLVPAISAAGILAKTTRDAMMISYSRLFPEYGFESHKGYGSANHMQALQRFGRCPIHRRSFEPVKHAKPDIYKYHEDSAAQGRYGELMAGMSLIRNGHTLLEHGYHAGRNGEIDLISIQDSEYVFTEVKSFDIPIPDESVLERVDEAKQKQIARTAEQYLSEHAEFEYDCRFDIITVNFGPRKPVLVHYENAYSPI